MNRYKFKRKGDTLTAIARTEGGAKSRLNSCFTNRHGKPGPRVWMELIEVEPAPRVDVHFYSKTKNNRVAADKSKAKKKKET